MKFPSSEHPTKGCWMDVPDVPGVSGETIPDSVPQVVHLAVGVSSGSDHDWQNCSGRCWGCLV